MKKLTSLLLVSTFLSANTFAKNFKSPDLIVDTKLNADWSSFLIKKTRRLLTNLEMSDPFRAEFHEPIIMDEMLVEEFLSEDSKFLLEHLGRAIGFNLLKGQTSVGIENLSYAVEDFKTDLRSGDEKSNGVAIASDFYASEVNISATKLSLGLYLPQQDRSKGPQINIVISNPVIKAKEEKLVSFFAKLRFKDQKDYFKVLIEKANFDSMANNLAAHPESVTLEYSDITIPEVSIVIGNRTIKLNTKKALELLKNNHEALKNLLVAQTASILRKVTGDTIAQLAEQIKIKKRYWIDTESLSTKLEIESFGTDANRNNLEITLPGDFCPTEKYRKQGDDCLKNKVTKDRPSRLTSELHERSIENMKSVFDRASGDMVASISEDYVNKLLAATYDAGLWKESLDEAGVDLGPKTAFVRLDAEGENATLYMDVSYKPSRTERFAIGRRTVRFPIVAKGSMRIENRNGIPYIILRINDIDMSNETLIYGKKDLGLESTVQYIPRLRGKVLNTIRTELKEMLNKDFVEIDYPELKGLGLESVKFLSDGNGRMNAIMKLEY